MPKPPLVPPYDAMLAKPNPAVISVLRPDGGPLSVPTWYDWERGRVLISMDRERKRLDFVRSDPRVSLTVLDADSWYAHVSLRGRATEFYDDHELADIDRLSMRYEGEPYAVRDRPRVSAWIEIDHYHAWGATQY